MRFTRQYDRMDCGPACISMVASAYGKTYPLAWLRTRACLTREGVSVTGIRNALNEIGMESASFRLTLDQIAGQCPLPAILHWDQRHFVVLEKVKLSRRRGRRWLIADPAFGRHWIDDNAMTLHWLDGTGRGVAIAIEPGDKFESQAPPEEIHSFVAFGRRHVWPFRGAIAKSALIMLGGMLLSLILPFLTQAMVDRGVGGRNPGLVFSILAAQVALVGGSMAMQYLGSRVTLFMSTHISISVISSYLEKLLHLPMSFFDTKSAGDYQQRIADHSRLRDFLTVDSLQTLFSLVSVPFYLAIISCYSLVALAAYLLFTAMAIIWSLWFLNRRKALDYERFQLDARARNHLFEMTDGIVDIKVNGFECYKINQWRNIQKEQYEMSRRALKLSQRQGIGFQAISQIRNMVILCWIALSVIDGTMTFGMMMSVSVIIGMISGPLGQLTEYMQRLQDARISLERSDEVNFADNEDRPAMSQVDKSQPLDIELRGVTFAYGGAVGRPAVEDVSFSIPAGSFVAIVGESGSGKTTLMKLLLKFYPPQKGQIYLGGRPMEHYSAESLRHACGVVMQDNFLFSDTIERNIVLGESADMMRMSEAIDTACLNSFIESRPLGIHTMAGAEGNGLSGGEKQRIMLARVAYKHPPYIILDEATSSLDAETERQITENFATRFSGSTRIVIAHRLSTVRNADFIIVMRHGHVVETGTHSELVELGGYYLTLVRNQLELAAE